MAVLLLGCDQWLPEKKSEQQHQKRSGISDALDTVVVQGGKVRAGQRAADKLYKIDAQRQQDIGEVMGD